MLETKGAEVGGAGWGRGQLEKVPPERVPPPLEPGKVIMPQSWEKPAFPVIFPTITEVPLRHWTSGGASESLVGLLVPPVVSRGHLCAAGMGYARPGFKAGGVGWRGSCRRVLVRGCGLDSACFLPP